MTMTYTREQADAARLIRNVEEGKAKATRAEIAAAVLELGYASQGTKDEMVAAAYAKAVVVGQTHAKESDAAWQAEQLAKFGAEVAKRVDYLRLTLRTWARKVAEAPNIMWELEGSDSAFRDAALLERWETVRESYEAGATVADIHAGFVNELWRQARSQRHNSTSVTSNLAAEVRRLALADVVVDRLFVNCGLRSPGRI